MDTNDDTEQLEGQHVPLHAANAATEEDMTAPQETVEVDYSDEPGDDSNLWEIEPDEFSEVEESAESSEIWEGAESPQPTDSEEVGPQELDEGESALTEPDGALNASSEIEDQSEGDEAPDSEPLDEQVASEQWIEPSTETGLMQQSPSAIQSFTVAESTKADLLRLAAHRGVDLSLAIRDALKTTHSIDRVLLDGGQLFVEMPSTQDIRSLPWDMIPNPAKADSEGVELQVELDQESLLTMAELGSRYNGDMNSVLDLAIAVELFFARIERADYLLAYRMPEFDGTIKRLHWRAGDRDAKALLERSVTSLQRARGRRKLASLTEGERAS